MDPKNLHKRLTKFFDAAVLEPVALLRLPSDDWRYDWFLFVVLSCFPTIWLFFHFAEMQA
ncbi:hypothetical protein M431DRAFT_509598 [Trichoderma harzianum CBS 226.95]|jgi:hypothetical protein|uniref:Uncharacterized protein n=1 Tax=Trichoderma harzianum CBS 226.95 TaxID=983964 RepID=A0A2T4A8A7_TRIHA|nr:hypothetical protein M431DRAFT_509598 [Trichoderma harzianum CBS 226.95]PTB53310.1 hypothetical protein M431DRAFT_509598 [Trichoderma harzianum CBS 226.95]